MHCKSCLPMEHSHTHANSEQRTANGDMDFDGSSHCHWINDSKGIIRLYLQTLCSECEHPQLSATDYIESWFPNYVRLSEHCRLTNNSNVTINTRTLKLQRLEKAKYKIIIIIMNVPHAIVSDKGERMVEERFWTTHIGAKWIEWGLEDGKFQLVVLIIVDTSYETAASLAYKMF